MGFHNVKRVLKHINASFPTKLYVDPEIHYKTIAWYHFSLISLPWKIGKPPRITVRHRPDLLPSWHCTFRTLRGNSTPSVPAAHAAVDAAKASAGPGSGRETGTYRLAVIHTSGEMSCGSGGGWILRQWSMSIHSHSRRSNSWKFCVIFTQSQLDQEYVDVLSLHAYHGIARGDLGSGTDFIHCLQPTQPLQHHHSRKRSFFFRIWPFFQGLLCSSIFKCEPTRTLIKVQWKMKSYASQTC